MRRLSLSVVFLVAVWASFSSAADSPVATQFLQLPAVAQANISATIGRDDASYAARRNGAGLHAENSRIRLGVDFNSSGVTLRSGASRWGMRLVAYGYGDALQPVAVVSPQAKANRVEYQRGAMTEWYANGPAGLEQGFTLKEAPVNPQGKPLTIALALSGDQRATLDKNLKGLLLGNGDKDNLRYTGLSAYDANGKELRAWLELRGEQLQLRVEDAGAQYPVVIDPWVQVAELTASDSQAQSFGVVSISGDTIAVGAPLTAVGSNSQQGAAYIFVKPATGWKDMTETAKLTASDGGSLDLFGLSIATNGSSVVVGARGHNSFQGVVYVFLRPKSGWKTTSKFTAELTPSDGKANDYFGQSLAMDGNTVVVTGLRPGLPAYVYVRPAGGWKSATQTAKLTTIEGAGLGPVGISGNTVVASGALNNAQIAAYVYVQPTAGWRDMAETAKLNASDQQKNDGFGQSVGISGNTIVAGSPFAKVGGNSDQGAAYVFVKPASGWKSTTETAKLTASDGASYDVFGVSIAIRGDTVAVGAPNAIVAKRYDGAVYLFLKPNGGWKSTSIFQAKLKTFDANGYYIAFADYNSLAIGNGVVVVGAREDHPKGQQYGPGSAFVFTRQ
jgi:hypothetical protein